MVSVAPMLPERIATKIDQQDENGCWVWTGGLSKGYAQISWKGRPCKGHRVVWEILVGPVPDGLVLDHLCRNKACVRPDHLDPVTQHTNLHRGETVTARNAAATHCPQGHPYDGDNLVIRKSGDRRCRACHTAEVSRSRLKRLGRLAA